MAITLETVIMRFIGLSTDTKPTGVPPGSIFLEYDTGTYFISYDGANWKPLPARAKAGLLSSGVKSADASIKASPGAVYWLTVSDTAALLIELSDSVAGTGTDLWALILPAGGYAHFIFDPPIEFSVGIYLDMSTTGTGKVVIGYI